MTKQVFPWGEEIELAPLTSAVISQYEAFPHDEKYEERVEYWVKKYPWYNKLNKEFLDTYSEGYLFSVNIYVPDN